MTSKDLSPQAQAEKKHTPGPWHVGKYRSGHTKIGHVFAEIVVGQIDGQDQHAHICYTFNSDIGESLANARLIAAAPELLEALRIIALKGDLCLCEHDDDDCCAKVGEFCAHCIAAVAIKKATGVQP